MAHHVEPMVIDSDFDNKENSLHHSNVLPFTEKGYEELDVSELNMKLRYSVTPTPSPMSKSYTANCLENKGLESGDDPLNILVTDTKNLTRSLNSTITKSDNVLKSLRTLPLQRLKTEQLVENNNRSSIFRPLEATSDNGNINVTITTTGDVDENLSSPSSISSALQTPEATTPTKDGGSPIMRGLKSVLNMFRSSQSPIPPPENENIAHPSVLSPEDNLVTTQELIPQMIVSTPISTKRKKEMSPTKRISPANDRSIIFNEDLEKELQWKDETTIFFSQERIPIHKLLPRQPQTNTKLNQIIKGSENGNQDQNSSVEYMDISCNDSIKDSTMSDIQVNNKISENTLTESDGEFVDCETTLTKESQFIESNKTPVVESQDLDLSVHEKASGCRLKQIVLNTTQDILDATLSVRPEDLLPEILDHKNVSLEFDNTDIFDVSTGTVEGHKFDQTVDVLNPENTEDMLDNANSTKIVEVTSIESTDKTLSETSTINNPGFPPESVNVINTSQYNLNETFKTEIQTGTDNLSTTLTVETLPSDDNICNEKITSVVYNLSENNSNEGKTLDSSLPDNINLENSLESVAILNLCERATDISLAKKEDNDSLDNTNIEYTLTSDPVLNSSEVVSTIPLPTTEDVEVIHTKEELPMDIPLPDEDDLEKDLAMDDGTKTKIICGQSLDIAEDIKMATGITDSTIVCSEGVDNGDILNNSDTIVLPIDYMAIAEDQNTNNKTMESHTISDAEYQYNIRPKEIDHSSVQMEQVIQDQDVTNMNTTQNISSLPDIINQTITLVKTENPEDIPLPVVLKKPIKTSNQIIIAPQEVDIKLDSEVIPEGNNIEKKIQIFSCETDKPNIDINIQNEDFTMPNINVFEMPSNNYSTPVNDEFSTQENVKDSEESARIDVTVANTASEPEETDHDNIDNGSQQVDEEVVLSENNSPFVSVTANNIPASLEGISEHLDAVDTSKPIDEVSTLCNSPPISTKGYYFDFDDINFDPFATEVNIRMSSPLDNSPHKLNVVKNEIKTVERPIPRKNNNRRKSQPNKIPTPPTRKFNATFDGSTNCKTEDPVEKFEAVPIAKIELSSPTTLDLSLKNVTIEEKDKNVSETTTVCNKIFETEPKISNDGKIEQPSESVTEISNSSKSNVNELKTTSSSEQSTYFSAGGTSSSDSSIHSRNVFNLPEIDDRNFNPFATKCKMQQSPPPSLYIENPYSDKSNIKNSPDNSLILTKEDEEKIGLLEDKIDAELMEKDNLNNASGSSKSTDEKNITSSEIHTEDEDTVEGPFLDADETDFAHKVPNFDGENIDMMQFTELPTQNNEENIDTREMFIDAEAFEFLLNQNKSNTIVDSGKESLFLKFDPLFAKRMSVMKSDSVVAALATLQNKESTSANGQRSPSLKITSPTAGPSNVNETQAVDLNTSEDFNDDLNVTVSKPMMVVPPAVNPITPRNKSLTPTRSNRRSITFTSPAMAVIDRLLSLSMNNSPAHDTTVTHFTREQNEADIALTQLRELLAEKEITVYHLKSESKELKSRLNTLESHLRTLEVEGKEKLKKINQLNETLVQKTKMNKSMAAVVEECERTIASLIAESAQDKKKHAEERMKLTNERDEQTAHLASMEVSFNDIHSKYEKSKQVIFQCKANEDMLKKSIKNFEENLAKMQNNYELLKQHATSKLNHANQELEKINKSHEAEVLKLNAMIKRKDLHITSLEESLIQKTKANEELTAICDELINKVS